MSDVGSFGSCPPNLYGQVTGTRAESGDYADGDGHRAHSAYERWSANAALGWTPDNDTVMELAAASSDGTGRRRMRGPRSRSA